jgi:hypothetical protein
MAQMIVEMNHPKEIVRDNEGNPVGIRNTGTGEIKTIITDINGLPSGIE